MSGIFFFNDTATTEIYTLSLHDASSDLDLQADSPAPPGRRASARSSAARSRADSLDVKSPSRSEEHTSELQSRQYLVCRLLLEKKQNSPHPPHLLDLVPHPSTSTPPPPC